MPQFTRAASNSTLVGDEEQQFCRDAADAESTVLLDKAYLRVEPTPLPKLQLFALCTLRLVEPVSFTHIFPYVNEMMKTLAVTNDPAKVGYYSGFVESIFAFAQLCSVYQWAKISDVVGRRPVLFVGAIGLALSSLLFGLSRSLTLVLVSRCLSGLFSGTASVVQSVLGDITDSTNQAIAFPIFGLIFPLGSIIGPLIGGSFANPAQQYPSLFNSAFWRDYPYFLPGAIAAAIAVLSVVLSYFFLQETVQAPPTAVETLPKRPTPVRADSYGTFKSVDSDDTVADAPVATDEAPTVSMLLASPLIRALCASGLALSFLGTAFHVVFVLFCFSPVSAGGLSLSSAQIGYALSSAGFASAAAQILLMPRLLARCDLVRLNRMCMGAWPVAFALLPALGALARASVAARASSAPDVFRPAMWVGLALALLLCQVGWLSYSVSMILVKQSAPSPAYLGRTNGLAQLAQCLARAAAPAFVSSLYAGTAASPVLGGNVWAVIMVALAYWGYTFGNRIEEARHLLDEN